jgi:hypothetical protein
MQDTKAEMDAKFYLKEYLKFLYISCLYEMKLKKGIKKTCRPEWIVSERGAKKERKNTKEVDGKRKKKISRK